MKNLAYTLSSALLASARCPFENHLKLRPQRISTRVLDSIIQFILALRYLVNHCLKELINKLNTTLLQPHVQHNSTSLDLLSPLQSKPRVLIFPRTPVILMGTPPPPCHVYAVTTWTASTRHCPNHFPDHLPEEHPSDTQFQYRLRSMFLLSSRSTVNRRLPFY